MNWFLKRLPKAKLGYKFTVFKTVTFMLNKHASLKFLIWYLKFKYCFMQMERHQRECWEGFSIPPDWIPRPVSVQHSPTLEQSEGTREKTEKENIVEKLTYLHSFYSTEDVHSSFFMKKPEQWLSRLSHGGQATMFTVDTKHPKWMNRDLFLCIVSALIVNEFK